MALWTCAVNVRPASDAQYRAFLGICQGAHTKLMRPVGDGEGGQGGADAAEGGGVISPPSLRMI